MRFFLVILFVSFAFNINDFESEVKLNKVEHWTINKVIKRNARTGRNPQTSKV